MATVKIKQSSVIPARVPFEQWKVTVLTLIKPASSTGTAFKPWLPHLRVVYDLTRPLLATESERKTHAHLRESLLELSRTLHSVMGQIDTAGGVIIPKSGWIEFSVGRLRRHLAESRQESLRVARLVLRPREQNPKVYDHCMPFIHELRKAFVGIEDIAGICMVLMQAHGFTQAQLIVFTPSSVKKRKTLQKAIAADDRMLERMIERSSRGRFS